MLIDLAFWIDVNPLVSPQPLNGEINRILIDARSMRHWNRFPGSEEPRQKLCLPGLVEKLVKTNVRRPHHPAMLQYDFVWRTLENRKTRWPYLHPFKMKGVRQTAPNHGIIDCATMIGKCNQSSIAVFEDELVKRFFVENFKVLKVRRVKVLRDLANTAIIDQ